MTPLELYDQAIENIRKQGKPSVTQGMCAYRSSDGCKCAAGFYIPDDVYKPQMEGKHFNSIVLTYDLPFNYSESIALRFAQKAHDGAANFYHQFINEFEIFARREREKLIQYLTTNVHNLGP
jgi:hypothetical protein